MKKQGYQSWAALMLVLMLCVSAYAAEETDPIFFTFEGQEYRESTIVYLADIYAQGQYISSATAYDEAIDYLIINQLVPQAKAAELGLDQYTDEEMAQMKAEAAEFYEAQVEAYVRNFVADGTDEEKEEFRQMIRQYWEEIGTTVEAAEENYIFNATKARLLEYMGIEISEEEIRQTFEAEVEKDRNTFSENVLAYEFYTYYRGADVWYTPEGFRNIHQILLYVDSQLTAAYKEAGEDAEEARQAILDARKEDLAEIYAQLEAGAAFDDVMRQYSEDPSLEENGETPVYMVHAQSTVWGKEFAAGAFSEDMEKPGDVSQPIVSQYGIHVLYYAEDVPAGPVEFSDRIRESVENYLLSQKRSQTLLDWKAEYDITIYEELVAEKMADAKAAES